MKSEKHEAAEVAACFDEDEQAFVEGVLARGEAARSADGELPAGATHEIVDDDHDGAVPKIRRTRFKAF